MAAVQRLETALQEKASGKQGQHLGEETIRLSSRRKRWIRRAGWLNGSCCLSWQSLA
jgi:hypothetical protein